METAMVEREARMGHDVDEVPVLLSQQKVLADRVKPALLDRRGRAHLLKGIDETGTVLAHAVELGFLSVKADRALLGVHSSISFSRYGSYISVSPL